MLAAVSQMTSGGIILENLAGATQIINRAAKLGAKLICLPEATDFIAPATEVSRLTSSRENFQFVEGIRAASKENGVTVSVGIHEPHSEEKDKGRCFNTQLLIDPKGEIIQMYRKVSALYSSRVCKSLWPEDVLIRIPSPPNVTKLHLFDVDIKGGLTILESNTTIPGSSILPPVSTSIGKIGLLTCYDLRFPEPSLSLRRQGAQVLTYPSAFTTKTGAAHWELLLRARAVETQSYVIAAAQVGSHPGTKRVSYGHALICDPWGSVVAQCTDMQPYEPTFVLADIVSLVLLHERELWRHTTSRISLCLLISTLPDKSNLHLLMAGLESVGIYSQRDASVGSAQA